MKQFWRILSFEFTYYLKNKIFVGITLFLAVGIALTMSAPRLFEALEDGEDDPGDTEKPVMMLAADDGEVVKSVLPAFAEAFGDYEVKELSEGKAELEKAVESGLADCGFYLEGLTKYTYFVDNLSMYDMNEAICVELLTQLYRNSALIAGGVSPEVLAQIMAVVPEGEVTMLGQDQMENFFYTYIMIFALYMVILLYGQMVATNVASEKASRAMEVLVTSAKPVAMMFGKVIASCLAGLCQLLAVFGSALLFFGLNKEYWAENEIVVSIFNIPPDLLIYMLIFFVLGFFIYAFLYGAIGSTATKLEDINTSVMPVTFLFIFGFMVVMMSLASGETETVLMQVCSFVPFTSPMAMFTRIAMGAVPIWQIALSIGILALSVVGVGVISAKIYRVGVLLYGTPPKLGAILKAIRKA